MLTIYRPLASDSLYSIPTLYFSTKGIHTDSILFNIQYIILKVPCCTTYYTLDYQYFTFLYELETLFRTLKYILTYNIGVKNHDDYF